MRCQISTCSKREPRKGAKVEPGMCLGHAWLWVLREKKAETRAEFVDRQERQDMLRGKTKREAA